MVEFNIHLVAYCQEGFANRQLVEFATQANKDSYTKALLALPNANTVGDWIQVQSESDWNEGLQTAQDLGGIVFDLPVRSS